MLNGLGTKILRKAAGKLIYECLDPVINTDLLATYRLTGPDSSVKHRYPTL